MLALLTLEEQQHERIWGTVWREGEPLCFKRIPWIKDDEGLTLYPLPPIKTESNLVYQNKDLSLIFAIHDLNYGECPTEPGIFTGLRNMNLVNEKLHYNASRILGDFGQCNMKGFCPVCNKPVYHTYPWWDNSDPRNPYHDECYSKLMNSDPENII